MLSFCLPLRYFTELSACLKVGIKTGWITCFGLNELTLLSLDREYNDIQSPSAQV